MDPTELLVTEDPKDQTRSEVNSLLSTLNETSKGGGGLTKVTTTFGIIGSLPHRTWQQLCHVPQDSSGFCTATMCTW